MNKAAYLKRIARLQSTVGKKLVTYVLATGERLSMAKTKVMQHCVDAIYGTPTEESVKLLTAVSACDDSQLHVLLQMVLND